MRYERVASGYLLAIPLPALRRLGAQKVPVNPRLPRLPTEARRIVVADQDRAVVRLIVETLRSDGHAVFHAYDADSASRVARAMTQCDLVISNTRVAGNVDGQGLVDGVDLIAHLREDRPDLPILYLANPGRSTPEMEAELPPDVPILRVPFTPEELRANVDTLLQR